MKKVFVFVSAIFLFGCNSANYTNLSTEAARVLAEKNGVEFRVVQEDGQGYIVTDDYVVGRINAIIENGVVVDYEVEGN